jgi:hypothetical protein
MNCGWSGMDIGSRLGRELGHVAKEDREIGFEMG